MNVQIPTPATIDLATIKDRQHAAWGSGDYARIGTTLQIVGETLCEAVEITFAGAPLSGIPLLAALQFRTF
jgi:hypothetical protein